MTADACRRAGCTGTVVDGFCDTCGMAPTKLPPPRASQRIGTSGTPVASVRVTTSSRTSAPSLGGASSPTRLSTSTRGFGLGLVSLPDVVAVDPSLIVLADPEVPEKDRFCAQCGEPVGRSRGDREGRRSGFCPSCRNAFDFTPKLASGDVVAGQYEVAGCLAHGGLGWIYLARDRNVSDRWVVLKGVLDSGNEDARAAALAERRFLAAMEHPEIVRIYNFVVHRGAEYIVMEYIGGKSLKTILKERRETKGGAADPLPPDQALAYVIGILPALSYLHEHGYVYCDFKPDNVIHQGSQLKLIDLGGVRHLGDPSGSVYGTVGFQAPEIAASGPSISSDLYTVMRTLAVLCLDFRGYTSQYKHSMPPLEEHPLLLEFDSLARLLRRGMADDPVDRFQNVEELAEQLGGVLREVVAVRTGIPRPATSAFFTGDLLASAGSNLDGTPDWRMLPVPLISSSDPAAGFLVNLSAPAAQVPAIIDAAVASGLVECTVETHLRKVRAHLEADGAAEAVGALAQAEASAPADWRIRWYQGLVALAQGDDERAMPYVEAVRSFLPGELGAQVAVAYALEHSGQPAAAAALYDRVSATDPSFIFAAFGLGRCCSALGDRPRAVAAYARIPSTSVLHDDAGVSTADALLDDGTAPPRVEDVVAAAAVVDRLDLDAKRRAQMARRVLTSALDCAKSGVPMATTHLFGEPFEERALRRQLEAVLRDLASHEPDERSRISLVDEANRVRPRTLW